MTEVWRDIRGFPGYQVSSLGRVRTHNKVTFTAWHGARHWKDRVLKQKVSKKDNCSRVSLWAGGIERDVLVHRLVADAFLWNNLNTDMTVNHKDGNRQNNAVENLEWLSRGDNIRYGFEHGQYPTCKPVVLVTNDGNKFEYRSQVAASKAIGRYESYINRLIRRNKHTAVGRDGTEYAICTF